MSNTTKPIVAKFVSIEEKNGVFDLCFLAEDRELVEFKEYSTREAAEAALKYWTGPKKTLVAVEGWTPTNTTTAPTETWNEDGFPFEKLEDYPNLQSALAAGCKEENLWSICDGDDPDVWVYGPPHHHVNLLAIAHTAEAHDGRTYYVEDFNA